jgi:hypothetical protein
VTDHTLHGLASGLRQCFEDGVQLGRRTGALQRDAPVEVTLPTWFDLDDVPTAEQRTRLDAQGGTRAQVLHDTVVHLHLHHHGAGAGLLDAGDAADLDAAHLHRGVVRPELVAVRELGGDGLARAQHRRQLRLESQAPEQEHEPGVDSQPESKVSLAWSDPRHAPGPVTQPLHRSPPW